MRAKHGDGDFDKIFHHPCGEKQHQGSLIRGPGLWEPKGCCHDAGFRRFTSQKLETLKKNDVKFMIERGCHPPFTKTWVFTSHAKVTFDEARMDQYLKLTFATCLDDARQHFPKRADAKLCLGAFRK